MLINNDPDSIQERNYENMRKELTEELFSRNHSDYIDFINEQIGDDQSRIGVMLRFLMEPRDKSPDYGGRDAAVCTMVRGWLEVKTKEYLDHVEEAHKLEALCAELGVEMWWDR